MCSLATPLSLDALELSSTPTVYMTVLMIYNNMYHPTAYPAVSKTFKSKHRSAVYPTVGSGTTLNRLFSEHCFWFGLPSNFRRFY